MKKWILGLIVFMFFAVPRSAQAAAEFGTTYDVTYQVMTTGVTNVRLKISLENKLSNVYADRFSLSVGFTDVSNVRVSDAVGQITPDVSTSENQTVIAFRFIDKVVGKGEVNTFVVSYDTRDIAVKNGSVFELNIPQIETDKGVSDQKVTLLVPSGFGLPAFITPKPDSETRYMPTAGTNNVYVFSAKTLGTKAISAVFGSTQFMRFNLIYHLENRNPVRQEAQIALPPDTNYQQMIYESIEPKPIDVAVDEDGNFIASYLLDAGEILEVSTVGVVKLNFTPKPTPLENTELNKYLAPQKHWETMNPQVRTLAQQLRTPEAIYEYVVDYLSYDYSKVVVGNQRVGAMQALTQPLRAICTEFTDLFVTLSRAAGVPARELEGYAFTNNDKLRPLSLTQDVLHAWPEYYDLTTSTWKQVDPTWGNTTGGIDYFHKLDLNHFVFVIHGMDSVTPLPAGAYKTGNFVKKDVKVIASDPVTVPEDKLEFKATSKRKLLGGEILLLIKNVGMVSSAPFLSYSSKPSIISGQEQVTTIPPYGSQTIEIELGRGLQLRSPKELILKYDQEEITIPVEVDNERTDLALKVGAFVIVLSLLASGAYWAYRLLIRRRK